MDTAVQLAPLWSQDQAIAYEVAIEAINDVIAGYSEQIAAAEQIGGEFAEQRVAWLAMRVSQAIATRRALDVTDDANVAQVIMEFSAIVRARDAAEAVPLAA